MDAFDFVTTFARRNVADARVRPYGVDVADLAIDFDAPRPMVATRVIAACLRVDDEAVWNLTVRDRILLLLGISEMSLAQPIEAHVACACGETAVVELATSELAAFVEERASTPLVAGELELRLPTGRDQLRWTTLRSTNIALDVLADLVVTGELTDTLVPAVDQVLAHADPLIEFAVETSCTKCNAALSKDIDLERIALVRLRNARRILLEQVHAIASTYHWTEAEISTLPAWRRAEYAALVRAV
ncbi:MAG: hypothetical protein QM831_07500 [Kofleriaceae bacterium]